MTPKRRTPSIPVVHESVAVATEAAIGASTHLTPLDDGAVQALRVLARKVDELAVSEKFDNVTLPTYLKYCDALGLTPAGRRLMDPKKETVGGNLARLRSVASA